jgi:hypothetical protein
MGLFRICIKAFRELGLAQSVRPAAGTLSTRIRSLMFHRGLSLNTNALTVIIGQMTAFLLHLYQVQTLTSNLINSLAKNFIFCIKAFSQFISKEALSPFAFSMNYKAQS